MPNPEFMTWEPKTRRWTRMHKGKRFWVSCRQLGTAETKADSLRAANAWWTAKQAELDTADKPAPRTPLPLEDVAGASLASRGYSLGAIAKIIERDFVAESLRRLNLSPDVRRAVESLFAESDAEPQSETVEGVIQTEISELLAAVVAKNKPMPDGFTERLPPARLQQIEGGINAIRGESVASADRTIQTHASAWIASLNAQADAGGLTVTRVNNVRMAVAHFARWLGETADVQSIDASKVQGYYEHCLSQISARRKNEKEGWSLSFAKEVFAVCRAWIRWLSEQGVIDAPRNLASRFRFGSNASRVAVWTADEVRRVISEAPGKLKLALMLMLNCGMTQIDVSDLQEGEVAWDEGRVTRKRSKTSKIESAPIVSYLLWPATFKLLRQYRSGTPRVLLTESGRPFVRNEMANGKVRRADGFTSNYKHLQRRLGFPKPLKQLRKTSASLLESHPVYGRLTSLFLGHAPATMREKHYAAPPQALLDEAIKWLGKQLGFVDPAADC
jgi:integrase